MSVKPISFWHSGDLISFYFGSVSSIRKIFGFSRSSCFFFRFFNCFSVGGLLPRFEFNVGRYLFLVDVLELFFLFVQLGLGKIAYINSCWQYILFDCLCMIKLELHISSTFTISGSLLINFLGF